MKLYEAVTADAYELPLAVADSVTELARMTGYSKSLIRNSISHQRERKTKGVRFVRVEIDDENAVSATHGSAPVTWKFAKPPERPVVPTRGFALADCIVREG